MKKPQSGLVRFCVKLAAIALLVAAGCIAINCLFVNSESHIASSYLEVDITSGRTRVVNYDWWMRSEEAPEETWVTRALRRGGADFQNPQWKTYASYGRHPALLTTVRDYSAAYAFYAMLSIESEILIRQFTPDAQTEIARRLVALWTSAPGSAGLWAGTEYRDALLGWDWRQSSDSPVTAEQVRNFHEGLDSLRKMPKRGHP